MLPTLIDRIRLVSLLLLGVVGLVSCDSAPGLDEGGMVPPQVSDLLISPVEAVFDALPASQISGDVASIPLALSVHVKDLDASSIREVKFVVLSPGTQPEIVLEGNLQTSGLGLYRADPVLELDRGAVGTYAVKVWALDSDRRLSNQMIASFVFRADGNPPVLESVTAPDTVTRPAAGQPPVAFAIICAVSDPDGLGNIQRVILRTAGGTELLLRDDGGAGSVSGDAVAGDGLFTITVEVGSGNALGANTFEFQAFDRGGLASNTLQKTITIVE